MSPGAVRGRTKRRTSSDGNWHGCSVFFGCRFFTLLISQTSPGFFAERVSAQFPFVRTFIVPLARVLLRDTDAVKVEPVIVRFRCPDDRFVSPGKPPGTVRAVAKCPDNSASNLHSEFAKYWNDDTVDWHNLAGVDVVSDLPADRTVRSKNAVAVGNNSALEFHVVVEPRLTLVRLPDVIRRARQHEVYGFRFDKWKDSCAIGMKKLRKAQCFCGLVILIVGHFGMRGFVTKRLPKQ